MFQMLLKRFELTKDEQMDKTNGQKGERKLELNL